MAKRRKPPKAERKNTDTMDCTTSDRQYTIVNTREKDSKTLEQIGETLDAVLAEIKKPRHIALRILDIAAAGISVFGIITIIEKVMEWITGG
jgi:hypothetical protein